VLELFPETGKSSKRPPTGKPKYTGTDGDSNAMKGSSTIDNTVRGHSDNGGSAARFFYCAKASKKDRNEGLPTMSENHESSEKVGNTHPTVKPTALMAYLCRLITPTGGVVLDPYMGSGSTGKAAVREGFSFVGCELDKDYFDIATARVNNEDD
jgi:site-specific DNA-methyltransferase (adenine-specific)